MSLESTVTSRYARQRNVPGHIDRALFDGGVRVHNDGERREAYLASPTVQSHAAMLARMPGGDLGVAWFGGTQEGVGDTAIWFSRLPEGSDTWSEPIPLTDDGGRSEQNPVLFPAPDGAVWLLYTAQVGGNQDTAEVRRRISLDDGVTWGAAETLFPTDADGGLFIRQPVVVTATGRWLLPVFHCASTPGERWVGDHDWSAVMISDDAGSNWREVDVPQSLGSVHMSIVSRVDGTLHALFRSRWADAIQRSVSINDGETWSVPRPTDLPNNNSSIQHAALPDGTLAVVYNHSSRLDATERRVSLYDEIEDDGSLRTDAAPVVNTSGGPRAFWGAPRAPMSLALSSDGGQTWSVAGDLEQGDGYCLTNNSRDGLNREFSYPVLLPRSDGAIDIAYTFHRQTIKHVRLPGTWRRP